VDGGGGGFAADHAAAVVGHTGFRALDLALAGEALELEPDLVGLGAAGRANRVALGEEAAAGVDGDAAADLGDALSISRLFAFRQKPNSS
jgi:hypothetical protein